VKRKSMDEEAESERIRQLEATLHRLKNGIATEADQEMAAAVHANQNGDDTGSDSDSDSSSGSDSE
jgi:bromodomain-containing factor 1